MISLFDSLWLGWNELFPNRSFPTHFPQFYDIYANLLRYFPGPHTKIYDILEDMRGFIARRVKKNKETLDPNSPRDYIDCFLIQMEKVGGRQGAKDEVPSSKAGGGPRGLCPRVKDRPRGQACCPFLSKGPGKLGDWNSSARSLKKSPQV